MNYNLKNKMVALIALSFTVIIAMNNVSFAEEEALAAENQAVEALDNLEDDLLGIEAEAENAVQEVANEVQADADQRKETIKENTEELLDEIDNIKEANTDTPESMSDENAQVSETSKLSNSAEVEEPKELFNAEDEQLITPPSELTVQEETAEIENSAVSDNIEDSLTSNEAVEEKESSSALPETEAPKSPFESFGNAILAKVDNDLFNQMSSIEKQTTLLRLEIKREELKNRVEALRNARLKAQEEEAQRKRAEEERLKDLENKRQAELLREQQALKEKEIELEKVRQGKVLNDYMNQMLLMNQKWIEENGNLHNRIKELEEERVAFINDIKEKFTAVQQEVSVLPSKASEARDKHTSSINALNNQINQLRHSVVEAESKLRQLKEGIENQETSDPNKPGKGAIDMSDEYAIMDITGKGDDVVAKIVSRDGTTFIVHKGTMLKNGEVVTSITDHYISFENNGVESYLYTGGTVMEYEPIVTFEGGERVRRNPQPRPTNGKDKSPSQNGNSNISIEGNQAVSPQNAPTPAPANHSVVRRKKSNGSSVSIGQGMFVK